MHTRSVTLVSFLIASAIASPVAVHKNAPSAEGTASSVSHPADHVHNLLHQRRLKSAKADKAKSKAKSSKVGTTGTGGDGAGMGSAAFSGLTSTPILGSNAIIVDTSPIREDEESQDANGSNDANGTNGDNGSSEPAPNRGDGNGAGGIQTGGGSANAGNPFLDCGKSIPTADGPFQTEPCRGSCECASSCCIQYHAGTRFCAPMGNDGWSTIGGGFMRCL